MAKPLTRRQEVFVAEYLIDMNAARAAIAAGYSANGAKVAGHRLLTNVNVAAEIAAKHTQRREKVEDIGEKVRKELDKLCFFDPRKMFDADGRCKPITELDDETAAAITGFKTVHKVVGDSEDGCVVFTDYKWADRGANLRRRAELDGEIVQKVEHSGKVTLESLVCGEGEE